MTNDASVYIAAPFNRKDYAKEVREILDFKGYRCTSRWIDLTHEGDVTEDQLKREALEDLHDIEVADLVVICNDGVHQSTTGGLHFEHGYAAHAGKKIFILGVRTPRAPFHRLFETFERPEDIPDAAAAGF